METAQHSTVRPPGREHIPIYPRGFIVIRIVQLVLAVVIIALAAYSIHYGAYDANEFIMAVAVMTLVSSIYHMVAHFSMPALFNYWAILGLDALFIVLWLASFALLASRVADYYKSRSAAMSFYSGLYRRDWVDDLVNSLTNGGGSGSDAGSISSAKSTYDAWPAVQAAAAALGGVEFAIFIASLVIHSIRLHRHRAAGLHCMPGVPPTPPGEKSAAAAGTAQVPPVYQAYPQQQQQQAVPAYLQQQPQPQQGYVMQPYPVQPQQQQPPPAQGYYQPTGQVPVSTPSPAPVGVPVPHQN